jgi:hypothetical protein
MYYDRWEWSHLPHNSLYTKIFQPHLTDEFIDEVMSEIVKQE